MREALLADTPQHALAWDGKWSIDDCRVDPDPDNADRFIITLKLNEAGGAAMRALRNPISTNRWRFSSTTRSSPHRSSARNLVETSPSPAPSRASKPTS